MLVMAKCDQRRTCYSTVEKCYLHHLEARIISPTQADMIKDVAIESLPIIPSTRFFDML